MDNYLQLSRIYHDKNLRDSYDDIYIKRVTGEGTYKLPLKIKDTGNDSEMQLFVVLTTDNYAMTQRINEKLIKLKILHHKLPGAAIHGHVVNYILVDEMIKTNAIEGVHSSRKEIIQAIDAKKKKKNNAIRFQNQVEQYLKILNDERLELNSVTDLRNLYDEFLSEEVRLEDENDLPDGKLFRAGPVNVVSGTGKVLHDGLMPEAAIIDAVEKLILFIKDKQYPVLLRAAIGHYYFGYIHPFYNGNGRLGRLLTSYLLAEEFDYLVSLRLSVTIHENINQYYKAFEAVNHRLNRGDATVFYNYFLNVIENVLSELLEDLSSKYDMLCYAEENINKQDLSNDEKTALFIMQQALVFSDKNLGIKTLMKNMNLKRKRMQTILDSLETQGYIAVDKTGKEHKYVLKANFLE